MSTGFRRRIDSDSLGRQLGPELDDYCFPIGLGQCRVDFDRGLSGLSSGTLGPEMDDYCFPTDDMTTRGGAAQAGQSAAARPRPMDEDWIFVMEERLGSGLGREFDNHRCGRLTGTRIR